MFARLAFAVAINVDPDILIVDEALSVGDSLFQKRCFQKIDELASKGTTLLFVSHDVETVRTRTERAVYIIGGKIKAIGPSAQVVLDYRRDIHFMDKLESSLKSELLIKQLEEKKEKIIRDKSFGDFDAQVLSVTIKDEFGNPCALFYPGENITIEIKCKFHKSVSNPNIGIRIRNKEGVKIYSWGTLNQDLAVWSGNISKRDVFWEKVIEEDSVVTVELNTKCSLGAGFYEIQTYISEEPDGYYNLNQRMIEWCDEMAFFEVKMHQREYFFGGCWDMNMTADWQIS